MTLDVDVETPAGEQQDDPQTRGPVDPSTGEADDCDAGNGYAGNGDAGAGSMPGPRIDRDGPAPANEPSSHVVLGYRAGPPGNAVLVTGADLAARLNATLHVVHVVDLSDYPIDPDAWTGRHKPSARWPPNSATSRPLLPAGRPRGLVTPPTATRWRCCSRSPTPTTR